MRRRCPPTNPCLHPESLAAQGMGRVAMPYRDVVPPIYVSTTYERGADGAFPGGRIYSRADNPSYDQAEALIAALEGAPSALSVCFGAGGGGSGVPGARSRRLRARSAQHVLGVAQMVARIRGAVGNLDRVLRRMPRSTTSPQKRVRDRPRLIWIETPANPTWDITDIAAASAIASEVGAIVAVDSTAATPLLTRPLELGARSRHALGDQISERPCRRDRGCARHRARRRDVATHSVHTRRRWRGAWTDGGVAPAARNANAPFARRRRHAPTRSRSPSAFTAIRSYRMSCIPACRRIPGTPLPRRQMHGGFGGMMSLRLAGWRGRREILHGEARGLQARDVARIGREPCRASGQRRRTGNAVPR